MIDTEIIFLNGSNTFNGKKTSGKNTVVPLKKLDKTNKEENVTLNSFDLLKNLKDHLTQKIPTITVIINQTQAIFNISNMRNKYINSENENKLKT